MILICGKILAGMHFQVGSDPDLQENPGGDAFARGKMILIRGNILAGMHLRGESDPDMLKYQLRDACGAAKCIRKSRKSKSEMYDRPKQPLQARAGLSVGLSVCRITKIPLAFPAAVLYNNACVC